MKKIISMIINGKFSSVLELTDYCNSISLEDDYIEKCVSSFRYIYGLRG